MTLMVNLIDKFDWKKMDGLIPAIVQDSQTQTVLMLGYMNQAALDQTLATHRATFYSRSKQRLWVKGETSGNFLDVVSMDLDCDQDALLLQVKPKGSVCHKGNYSCFKQEKTIIYRLEDLIEARKIQKPENSYTVELMNSGIKRMAQKVGEEGVEVALAAMAQDPKELCNEAADLLFHLLVLLSSAQLSWQAVISVLNDRWD